MLDLGPFLRWKKLLGMSRKRYTPEQIIGKLREAEVRLSKGQTTGQAAGA